MSERTFRNTIKRYANADSTTQSDQSMYNDNAEEHMKMNMILRILEGQYPHSVSVIGIASLVNISVEKVELFLRFLAKYGFITYDEKRKTAAMCANFFLLEKKEKVLR